MKESPLLLYYHYYTLNTLCAIAAHEILLCALFPFNNKAVACCPQQFPFLVSLNHYYVIFLWPVIFFLWNNFKSAKSDEIDNP